MLTASHAHLHIHTFTSKNHIFRQQKWKIVDSNSLKGMINKTKPLKLKGEEGNKK